MYNVYIILHNLTVKQYVHCIKLNNVIFIK